MTMAQGWAYNPGDHDWKAPGQLVRNLVEVVSRGGNYLLNVGPTPEGSFPPEAVERLKAVGQWVDRNGAAIYGATYTEPLPGFDGRVTRKGNYYYLHLLDWPSSGLVRVDAFPAPVRRAAILGGPSTPFRQTGSRLEIDLPTQSPDPYLAVIEIQT